MGYQALLVDRADGIATVTMNRPEARNALNLTMREEMLGALDEIERDSAVRVMLLTGAGGHFSAGGDVKSMQKTHTAAEGRARVEMLNRFVLRLFNFPKPTIAMVDGFAVGAWPQRWRSRSSTGPPPWIWRRRWRARPSVSRTRSPRKTTPRVCAPSSKSAPRSSPADDSRPDHRYRDVSSRLCGG